MPLRRLKRVRLEHWLELIVDYIAFGAEIAAALVIGVAVVQGHRSGISKNLFASLKSDSAEATEEYPPTTWVRCSHWD